MLALRFSGFDRTGHWRRPKISHWTVSNVFQASGFAFIRSQGLHLLVGAADQQAANA